MTWAALDDRADAVRTLLLAGADANARSTVTAYPHTPPGVIGDKVEEGASYVGQSVLPKGGWTASMYASRQGALRAATALADAGADLNAADPDGSTALMFAIINTGHDDSANQARGQGRRREPRRFGLVRHRWTRPFDMYTTPYDVLAGLTGRRRSCSAAWTRSGC